MEGVSNGIRAVGAGDDVEDRIATKLGEMNQAFEISREQRQRLSESMGTLKQMMEETLKKLDQLLEKEGLLTGSSGAEAETQNGGRETYMKQGFDEERCLSVKMKLTTEKDEERTERTELAREKETETADGISKRSSGNKRPTSVVVSEMSDEEEKKIMEMSREEFNYGSSYMPPALPPQPPLSPPPPQVLPPATPPPSPPEPTPSPLLQSNHTNTPPPSLKISYENGPPPTPSPSSATPSSLPPSLTPLPPLPEPAIPPTSSPQLLGFETKSRGKIGPTLKQGESYEKFQKQTINPHDRPSPPPPPLSSPPPPLWFKIGSESATLNEGGSNQGFRKLEMLLFGSYRTPSSPSLPPPPPRSDFHASLQVGLVPSHQQSTVKITAPLNDGLKEATLISCNHGLKKKIWAKTRVLGSDNWDQTLDSNKGNNSNSNPIIMKSVSVNEDLSPIVLKFKTVKDLAPQSGMTLPTLNSASSLPIETQLTTYFQESRLLRNIDCRLTFPDQFKKSDDSETELHERYEKLKENFSPRLAKTMIKIPSPKATTPSSLPHTCRIFLSSFDFRNSVELTAATKFWTIVLATKFCFSYFLPTKPVTPTTKDILDLTDVTYEWHQFYGKGNRFAVGLLWLPVILIYFTDSQIWLRTFSSFLGATVELFNHLGEIRNVPQLRLQFQFFASARHFDLIPKEGLLNTRKTFRSEFKDEIYRLKFQDGLGKLFKKRESNQVEAHKFALIWNVIILTLREENIVSDEEVKLQPQGQAKELADTPDRLLWKNIGKNEYRRYSAIETYDSVRHLQLTVVQYNTHGSKKFADSEIKMCDDLEQPKVLAGVPEAILEFPTHGKIQGMADKKVQDNGPTSDFHCRFLNRERSEGEFGNISWCNLDHSEASELTRMQPNVQPDSQVSHVYLTTRLTDVRRYKLGVDETIKMSFLASLESVKVVEQGDVLTADRGQVEDTLKGYIGQLGCYTPVLFTLRTR